MSMRQDLHALATLRIARCDDNSGPQQSILSGICDGLLVGWPQTTTVVDVGEYPYDMTMAAETAELGFSRKGPEHHEALARLREWTRERFALAPDAAIVVSEVACRVPGCPPVETVVAFWIADARHHFKFFKPAREVAFGDFPPSWLRNALAVPVGFECDCC